MYKYAQNHTIQDATATCERGFSFGYSDRWALGEESVRGNDSSAPGPSHYDPFHQRHHIPSTGSNLGTFSLAHRAEGLLLLAVSHIYGSGAD